MTSSPSWSKSVSISAPPRSFATSTSSAPIYAATAAYGHFGRTDVDLPWEHLDKVDLLKETAKNL